MLDLQKFKDAMACYPQGVTLITTCNNQIAYAMTVSSFVSVTLTPPTVLICVNKEALVTEQIRQSGFFGVNLLSIQHKETAALFGGLKGPTNHKLEETPYTLHGLHSPRLSSASAFFDVKVSNSFQSGGHEVFLGEVLFAEVYSKEKPLIYHNRGFWI